MNSVQFWSLALSIAAAGGLTFAVLAAKDSLVASAFFGICLSVPIFAFERGVILRKLHLWINRLPTFGFILAGLSVYYILINIGFAIAGTAMWSIGLMGGSFTEATIIPPNILLYTLGVSAMLTFILRVRELLGRDIFASLIVGRYRQPVSENRVFLFIDLVGSTSYAEQYGDLRAQQFLSALFATFSEPVRRHRGTIDDYLGDAVLITWPYEKGIRDARCVRCVFDILDVIAANSAKWMREFGQVPSLRAALHGGPVITAEIGVDHHKITYFGDTVNTTARLEGLCRTLSANVLISGELALRINFPPEIAREQLGTHNVKGKGQPLAVVALKRQAPQQNADLL
ncbi:adenylate/guanylate cyclase domain-containing protein [Phyllobacterium sp. YR531]|uniref:adenylate/guanylate cyclase domain-containing protein n=1 Tax=Phyllobacterium sp. YR531 TaxID=1144343 RepID=UPI000593D6B9|nr:adenylate/guanylate cyclase domain-containing protein [Phyllobacterium sp. YR531]